MLRSSTADTHHRVETGLDLLDPGLTRERLADVLCRFFGFWAGTEPLMTGWLAAHPEHSVALRAERRGRCAHLRTDLAALRRDADALPLVPPVFERVGAAAALGWLYVTEGSTLGGSVIQRKLGGPEIAFFTPYPEGPGPMWKGYLEHVETWTADDPERRNAVVAAAEVTFDALAGWLEPVFAEVVS